MISKLFIQFGVILTCILMVGNTLKAQEAPSPTPLPAGVSKESPRVPDAVGAQPDRSVTAQEDRGITRNENVTEEESAILPYYNNYLKEYHLGPEDVISVEVFGQASYSKTGIVIPPTSRISYPLIPGGVFVGGKTVEEVAKEIKKGLDEYIIEPNVTVTLDKVGSARFSVLGKVAAPGVKVMNRRYNLLEALAEAGGIEKYGDKKRVLLVRMAPGGGFSQAVVDVGKVMEGKAEPFYLVPGDQVIVPEKRWSLTKIIETVGKASALRILFGSPF